MTYSRLTLGRRRFIAGQRLAASAPAGGLWAMSEFSGAAVNHRVYELDSGGSGLSSWDPTFGTTWSGLSADTDGVHLWAAQYLSTSVHKFDKAGTLIDTPADPGWVAGSGIYGMSCDPDGTHLWFSAALDGMIYRTLKDLTIVSSFAAPGGPNTNTGIAAGSTHVWVGEGDTVRRFTHAGVFVDSFTIPGGWTEGMDRAADGNLWIADPNTATLRKVTATGVAVSSVPAPGDYVVDVTEE